MITNELNKAEEYILVAEIRRSGQIEEEKYEEDGVHVKAYVPASLAGMLEKSL